MGSNVVDTAESRVDMMDQAISCLHAALRLSRMWPKLQCSTLSHFAGRGSPGQLVGSPPGDGGMTADLDGTVVVDSAEVRRSKRRVRPALRPYPRLGVGDCVASSPSISSMLAADIIPFLFSPLRGFSLISAA